MRRLLVPMTMAALAALAGCGSEPAYKAPQLAIEQPSAEKQLTAQPTLAVIGGKLAISEDGETRLPYPEGTNAGCVAAATGAMLILVPLVLLTGGVPLLATPDCEDYLPRLFLVHLEQGRAGALIVPPDGMFTAQLPVGTYLVAGISDNKSYLPLRLAFQAAEPGHAYNLGSLSVGYENSFWTGPGNFKLETQPDSSGAVEAGIARAAGGKAMTRHAQTPLRLATPAEVRPGAPVAMSAAGWNAFAASAITELHSQGMELIPGAAYAGMLPSGEEAEFIRRQQAAESKWAAAIANIRQEQCQPDMPPEACQASIAAAEAQRDAELKTIADERATAAKAADRQRKRQELEREWAARIEQVKRQYCRPPYQYNEPCKRHLAAIEAERDAALGAVTD